MEKKKNEKFIFTKSNYIFLIIGVVLNVIGFLLMIGGAAETKNAFDADELFSHVRITVAPILITLGYIVIVYSIMKKPKSVSDQSTEKE
jgi:heme/copper-type cytochrome/quinol oxidase subunit 2